MRAVTLPAAIRLPSGRRLRLRERPAADVSPLEATEEDGVIAASFDQIARAVILVPEDEEAHVALEDLALEDGHVLRALFARLGRIDEPEIEVVCENCERTHRLAPSRSTELAPFVDDELGDPELDAPFPFDAPLAIPAVVTDRGVAVDVVLTRRTVGEAEALWRRDLAAPPAITPRVVAALGVRRLGRETRLSRIAEALGAASSEARRAVFDHFESAHYGPRLVGSVMCECGARVFAPGPAPFELGERHRPPRVGATEPFTLAAFEERVSRATERIFARRRLRNIVVVVDSGVPACDAGGTPLLGSYGPADFEEAPPEVRLYYRTFCAEAVADPTFDWEAEVDETIEHELEHHENFLDGDDPLDDEERRVIAQEEARRVGKEELMRRAVSEVVADGFSFVRYGWPLLVLLLVLTIVMYFR